MKIKRKAYGYRKVIYLMFFLSLAGLTAGCRSSSGPSGVGNDNNGGSESGPLVSVYAYGIIEARRHSTLSAKFPGKLEKILVKEGEQVKKGQLLALFEARELAAQLAEAKAGVKVAEAARLEALAGYRRQEIAAAEEHYKAAQALYVKSQLDWDRFDDLYLQGVLPKSDWEGARLALEQAEAARNAARQSRDLLRAGARKETITVLTRKLALAKAKVASAAAMLDNARLVAPYDGVITRKHREEGEALDIGMPVLDISTPADRYVRVEIDETDIGKIRLGQQAVISADGFPNREFAGRVIDIKQQMGPKQLIPSDPSKIIDYKVLDIEVTLPRECPFPIKLPVNVRISLP